MLTVLRCVWVAPGLGTAVHSDSPFNQLKAALNYEGHVVDERGNASVALTSAGLSYFIKTPDKLASFIQEAFTLNDGSRISLAQAMGFAGSVCAHFLRLPSGTCAVALPGVPSCTTPMLLAFPHCVWVCSRHSRYGDAACKPWFSPCSPVRMCHGAWPTDLVTRSVPTCVRPPTDPAAHPDVVRGTVSGFIETSGTPACGRPPC